MTLRVGIRHIRLRLILNYTYCERIFFERPQCVIHLGDSRFPCKVKQWNIMTPRLDADHIHTDIARRCRLTEPLGKR